MGGYVGDRLGTSEIVRDITGETARRKAEEAARRQAAQFEAAQREAEAERLDAETKRLDAEQKARDAYARRAERGGLGRASTLLSGAAGVTGAAGTARRQLLPV